MATFTPSWQEAAKRQQELYNQYAQMHGTQAEQAYMGDPSKPYDSRFLGKAPTPAPVYPSGGGFASPNIGGVAAAGGGGSYAVAPSTIPGIGTYGQGAGLSPNNFNSQFFSQMINAGIELARANEPLKNERSTLQAGNWRIWNDKKKAAKMDSQRSSYSAFGQMGERGITGRGGFKALSIANILNELKRRNEEERRQFGDLRVAELNKQMQFNNRLAAQGLLPLASQLGAAGKPVAGYLSNVVRSGGQLELPTSVAGLSQVVHPRRRG